MDYGSMTIAEMRNFMRENRLRGYTRHRRRDDLIIFLRNSYQPTSTPTPRPPAGLAQPPQPHPSRLAPVGLPPPTWEPIRPQCTRPPHRMAPMGPVSTTRSPPLASPLVRFRPDRLRQPELLRQLEERNPQLQSAEPAPQRQSLKLK